MRRTTVLVTSLPAALLMVLVAGATAPPVLADRADDGTGVRLTAGVATRNGQIVFRRYFDDDQTKGAVFTMNPDGSHVRQVTHPPKGWRDNVPAWSPDGKRIVFERFKSDDSTSRVMVVNPENGNTRAVVPCNGERCAYAIDPYFSPDSRSIAYARTVVPPDPDPRPWQFYSAIFVVGLDGDDPVQVTSTPERAKGQPAVDTSDPTFSPDGGLLAFIRTRYRPEENSAVFVQPTGSPTAAVQVTPWDLNCQDRPTFSPDGTLVLFRCQPGGEEDPSDLYWVHPDGTALRKITHAPAERQFLGSSFAPRFHGESGWITAGRTGGSGEAGNADVFRVLLADGAVVRKVNLTRTERWDSSANWGTHRRAR